MNVRYILKLWASVIIVTPVLFLTAILFDSGGSLFDSMNLDIYLYAVLFGAVFSSPFLIILLVLSLFIEDYIKEPVTLKVFYIVASLIGLTLTIYIFIGGDMSTRDLGGGSIMMYYGISIFLFGMIYKIKTISDVPKEDEVA